MAKTTRILFGVNFYEVGEVKYAAGQHYPVTEETSRNVLAGFAEQIEVDMKGDLSAEKANADANADKVKELRADIVVATDTLTTAQAAMDGNSDPAAATRLANALADAKSNLQGLKDQLAILAPA